MEGEVGALSKLVPRFSHPAQGGGSDLCAIVAFRLLFGVSRVGGNLWVLLSSTFFIYVFFVCVKQILSQVPSRGVFQVGHDGADFWRWSFSPGQRESNCILGIAIANEV